MKLQQVYKLFLILFFSISTLQSEFYAQQPVYDWTFKKDGVKLGGVLAVWGGSIYMVTSADRLTEADLVGLDPLDINSFERGAIFNENHTADVLSDVGLIGSMLIGFSPYLGAKCRSEDYAVFGMALETFFAANALTNIAKVATKRLRPYTYNDDVPLDTKLSLGAGYSFPSGHTSASASLCFFSARVFCELYPESRWKTAIWTSAALIPMLTGYGRFVGGNHFPTDVMAGYALGALTGYLIPSLHKAKNKELGLSLQPSANGLSFNLTF